MANEIIFRGIVLPPPSAIKQEGQQGVDAARNALNVFVGQKVNRRIVKLNVSWNVLYPEQAKIIKQCIKMFIGDTRYYDFEEGKFITREMYWGDDGGDIYWTDPLTGKPKMITNFSTALIDTGKGD